MPNPLDPQAAAPSLPATPPATPAVSAIAQVLLDHEAELLAQLKPLTPGLRPHQPGEINAGIKRLCDWLREHALGLATLPGLSAPHYAHSLLDGAPALDPQAQALLEAWVDTLRRHASGKSQARLHKVYKAVRHGGDRAAQLSARHRKAEAQRLEKQARREQAQREAEAQHQRNLDFLQQRLEQLPSLVPQGEFSLVAFQRLKFDFKQLRGKLLTLAACVRDYAMPREVRTWLEAEAKAAKAREALERQQAAEQRRLEREARQKQWEWERSLVFSTDVPARLGITKAEYDRWLADGRLKPSLYREFRKWGQNLQTPLFDPVVLATLTEEVLAQYRAADAAKTAAKRSAGAKRAQAKVRQTQAIKRAVRMDRYPEHFRVARDLTRQWHCHLGPTNSGKTHAALQALMAAESGTYLAPLRLLALECYDRLKASGIPVSLLTGEERILDPHARHVCATVEMCDFVTPVEVAVVDEVQMLADAQRGWAWTAALLGVPARHVYACGARHAASALAALAAQVGDPLEEVAFSRLTPLESAAVPLDLADIGEGDALIAFSRREVLQYAQRLREQGLTVSVIYGALSPEVRRRQARAFLEGQTQVVVATDAIGLGLNLPLRRVVFSRMSKYDGVQTRELTVAEAQQIAGRAGRFGMAARGVATALRSNDLEALKTALRRSPATLEETFQVMPTWPHVATVLEELDTQDVGAALEFFARIKFGGPFQQPDLSPCLARLALLELSERPAIKPRDAFSLACAPADPDHEDDMDLLYQASRALEHGLTLELPEFPYVMLCPDMMHSSDLLRQAEAHSRQLALFSWLSCKWPGLVDDAGLPERREAVAALIDRTLLVHKEKPRSRRRRRPRYDDFDEDYGFNEDWA